MTAKGEAIYLLNDYIKQDATIQNLFSPLTVNIYPIIADEPVDGTTSYPYIRYRTVPSQGTHYRVRMDFVTYYIGDKSYATTGKIMERMWEILNMDDANSPIPIKDDKFKIHSSMFVSGTAPTGPDQENGVIERGITFAVVYTVLQGGL